MFLQQSRSLFELIGPESPGSVVDDAEPAMEPTTSKEQLAYAASCLRGWGYTVDISQHSGATSDSSALGKVLACAVEALRIHFAERDQQQERTTRMQSDLKSLQNMRQGLEEEKESKERDLAQLKNKARLMEESHAGKIRELQGEKEQLQRQLRDLKQQQKEHERALKRRDGDMEQLRQAQAKASLRHSCGAPLGSGAHRGSQGFNGGKAVRTSSRRMTSPDVEGQVQDGYAQRVTELEQELRQMHTSQAETVQQLEKVMARAEQLGFADALQLPGMPQPRRTSRAQRVADMSVPTSHSGAGLSNMDGQEASHPEWPEMLGLPVVQDRCRRWLAGSDGAMSWQGCHDPRELAAQLGSAKELLQQQSLALDSAIYAYRKQQEVATACEARNMALKAQLESALQQLAAAVHAGTEAGLAQQDANSQYHTAARSPWAEREDAGGSEQQVPPRYQRALSAPGARHGGHGPYSHPDDMSTIHSMDSHGRDTAPSQPRGSSPQRCGAPAPAGGSRYGTPNGRRTWATPPTLASPKLQISSMQVPDVDDSHMDGSVSVQVRGMDSHNSKPRAMAATSPDPRSETFDGFAAQQPRRQHHQDAGLDGHRRRRPGALDLRLGHFEEHNGGTPGSTQSTTPTLLVPSAQAAHTRKGAMA